MLFNTRILLLTALTALLTVTSALGQDRIPCYTSEIYRLQLKAHPEFEAGLSRFDRYAAGRQDISAHKTAAAGSRYIIPAVVHVIHTGGSDSISAEQVRSAFRPLFEDMRRVPDSRGYGGGADTGFEIELATRDPQGRPHPGIVWVKDTALARVQIGTDSITGSINDSYTNVKMKNLSRWDTTRYLNLWVVRSISVGGSGREGGIAGYAQYPWVNLPAGDGVVMDHKYWGTTGVSQGYHSTLTHEVGHWLALIHPFDSAGTDGCKPHDCLTDGDRACDVPPTSPPDVAGFKDIQARRNSCNNDTIGTPGDWADISANYMDYSIQENMANHYSAGQRNRGAAALENPDYYRKNKLWTEANHEATGVGSWGPPRADFWAENLHPCVNAPVQFTDYSMNRPTKYEWTFTGGTPATSTDPAPVVRYAAGGKYAVTLKVSNHSDSTSSVTKTDFITVHDEQLDVPFVEDFEGGAFPPAAWKIDNPDAVKGIQRGVTWGRSNRYGAYDKSSASAYVRLYNYDDYFQRDGLISPSFNAAQSTHLSLVYSWAYTLARFGNTNSQPRLWSDTLAVYASDDCGATWKLVRRRGGRTLMTPAEIVEVNDMRLGDFDKPAAWRTDTVNLNDFAGKPNVQIRFETINGWGANLFLDDVTVTDQNLFSSRITPSVAPTWRVYPNPAAETATVRVSLERQAPVAVEVLDVHGRVVIALPERYFAVGSHTFDLPVGGLASGVYVVRLQHDGRRYTQKLIRE